jgi:outer membrane protein assembly factor BamA
MAALTSLLLAVTLAVPVAVRAQELQEVIAAVRVHGNQIVPDDEVLTIAAVTIGAPFTASTLEEVKRRLEASGKFERVEVLKRFASITDPSQIIVVINASEGAVRITRSGSVAGELQIVRQSAWRQFMFVPLLDKEDGYDLMFGVRVAYPNAFGRRSRISAPLTWGGVRRAGLEMDRTFVGAPLSRVEVGGEITQVHNPAFDLDDQRRRVWVRGERVIGSLRTGVTAGWQQARFDSATDRWRSVKGDAVFDTRVSQATARNSIYAAASIERLHFRGGADSFNRVSLDARGYVGVFRDQTIAVRAVRHDHSRPAPVYMRWLLGGNSSNLDGNTSLRGFKPGFRTGDTIVASSVEWRIPFNEALSVGKLGVTAFADFGTAYEKGQRLRDQEWSKGAGGQLWFSLAVVRLNFTVARGFGSGMRYTFGGGLAF